MYFRKKTSAGRTYLQIVESRRDGDQVRQQVIATLGRFEELQASGQLERLLRSGARFAEKAMVLGAVQNDATVSVAVRRIGPALVFERLWAETGCRAVIEELAAARKHGFALERAVFMTVLHRLMGGGSDRAAERWREDYRIDGAEGLELHHLYRAMAWLGEELPEAEQDARTPFAPRCLKDLVEERLFARRRDLFTRLDLVFMDTTSLYFEGEGGQTLGRRGFNKDHRPDLKQMILAVLIDGDGHPVCSEMWPGNTTDVRSLLPVVDRLQRRFSIGRICIVADRGMISAETIAGVEARGLLYILGVRERSDKLVREVVLADEPPCVPLTVEKRKQETEYGAKTVKLNNQRYIVCINHQEAQKDAADRRAILESLERQLKKGDKALVGNTGYRRFLATVGDGHFAIDHGKAEEDKKFDGIFVLRTNTDLNPLQAMLRYKQLWTVEQTFKTEKHLFATRPIFHKLDETIRGHVACSFLALVLKVELEERIDGPKRAVSRPRRGAWPEILADPDSLTETLIEQDGKRFLVRSAPRPALPPTVRPATDG
jgi:transposase